MEMILEIELLFLLLNILSDFKEGRIKPGVFVGIPLP